MKLNSPGLLFNLELLSRQVEVPNEPYLDWLHCKVNISVPSFNGSFDLSLMPKELYKLSKDLTEMSKEYPNINTVNFDTVEGNINLKFSLNGGEYKFTANPAVGSTLTGEFDFDQSYINSVVLNILQFLKESE